MPPVFSRPTRAELTEEARRIFFILECYLQSTTTRKPSPALERFPSSLQATPWRRFFMATGAHSTAYLDIIPWDPSELSAGSARGIFWCFTELPRIGEKICRKTVDGSQSWSGRCGRGHKNGFPAQIRVAKLVIKGTAYHMLELTLEKEKPTVSLCKIWRVGAEAAEYPQTTNQGPSTSNQVEDNLEATNMQIDQFQGQLEGIEQQIQKMIHHEMMSDFAMCPKSTEECWNINLIRGQLEGKEQQLHFPGHASSMMSGCTVHPSSTGRQHEGTEQQLNIVNHHVLSSSNYKRHPNYMHGQTEGIEHEPDMPHQAMSTRNNIVPPNSRRGIEEEVKMLEDVNNDYILLPNSTEDFIPFGGQDDGTAYKFQGAASYIYEKMESFKQIASHGGEEAQEIASKAESLASSLKNLLRRFHFLRINSEKASNTTNNNQIWMTTNNVTEQATGQAPETMGHDESLDQERTQQQMEGCFIDEDYVYLGLDDLTSLD